MRICPHCRHANREGLLFCEECGRNLSKVEAATLPTKQIMLETDDLGVRATWGTARFEHDSVIVMHVRDAVEPITLSPDKRLVIGRHDNTSNQKPDIDLSPFGAIEKGVSRVHAAIYRNDDTLTIIDMGSSNGTHLNGQRLVPQQPRVLRDGDEIRLGQLVAHIYFKSH